jgi:hypothetical protein
MRIATRRGSQQNATRVLPQYLLAQSGGAATSLVEGFESAADWTPSSAVATITDDAVNTREGTQGVNLTTTGDANMTKATNWTPGPGPELGFWAYGSAGGYYLLISSRADFAKYFSCTTGPQLVTGWNYLVLHREQFENIAGDSWANTMVRMRIRFDSARNVTFDGLVEIAAHTGALILRFDDARPSAYTKAFAYMQPRRMYGVCAIITEGIGTAGFLTVAQLQEMNAAGWDMCNHTTDALGAPYLTAYNAVEQEAYIGNAMTALAGWGVGEARKHLIFPGGEYNADTLTAMAATGTLTGTTYRMNWDKNNTMQRINVLSTAGLEGGWHALDTRPITAATTLAAAKGYVDRCKRYGYLEILGFHDIVDTGATGDSWSTANLHALIDYIIDQDVPVIRLTDLYALNSGPVTIPAYWQG